jgi:hypothetical protein
MPTVRRTGLASIVATALLVAVLAIAVSGPGCGDSNGNQSSEPGEAPEKTEPAEERPSPVPKSLGTVESGAEDTIDFAHRGERVKVVTTARRLRRAAEGPAAADLRDAGVPEGRISAMRDRARLLQNLAPRADLARVSLAANQISALMPGFYARFEDPVPPDVLRLDYLDREAELRSLAGDEASVLPAVNELFTTWTRLRPSVIDAGGRRVAARYTRHVRSMRRLARGSDHQALQSEAVNGLELVDELEHQFQQR